MSALKATIDRLTESLAAEQRRAQSQQAALATANARVAELESSGVSVAATSSDELVARLRGSIHDMREELDRQHRAAKERLALIEDMEGRMRTLGAQVREARDAAERMRTAAQERLGVIERQQSGLLARDAEIAAKTAMIEKLEAMVGARRDDEPGIREELRRAHARVAELESLAEERLEVIRAMKNGRAG